MHSTRRRDTIVNNQAACTCQQTAGARIPDGGAKVRSHMLSNSPKWRQTPKVRYVHRLCSMQCACALKVHHYEGRWETARAGLMRMCEARDTLGTFGNCMYAHFLVHQSDCVHGACSGRCIRAAPRPGPRGLRPCARAAGSAAACAWRARSPGCPAGVAAPHATPALPSQPLRPACQLARGRLIVLQRTPQAARAQRCHAVPLLPDSSCRRPARRPQCLLACGPLRCPPQGGSASAGGQQAPRLQAPPRSAGSAGAGWKRAALAALAAELAAFKHPDLAALLGMSVGARVSCAERPRKSEAS